MKAFLLVLAMCFIPFLAITLSAVLFKAFFFLHETRPRAGTRLSRARQILLDFL
jgi:hypothetical protein